ncbi:L-histidine N(alpha)-methyltransferase [Flagellimonas amoyensis]|uniref:L-histidine N(alpha)-methyltransferase n=1 Tax=Flagellimonas amoyensis TaxID=2169401 RepID=UPI000D3B240A|nr:L-histidine N(alpha)-methyltransferase [Allomuricauda amoyensis]
MKVDLNGTGTIAQEARKNTLERFKEDVLTGLSSSPKHLYPKYFYDKKGSALFREIMGLPEYYLTNCELDIFKNKTDELSKIATMDNSPFDLIELGAGDGFKSKYLLRQLYRDKTEFHYMPIDISGDILDVLGNSLKSEFPDLEVQGLEGEYLEMLAKACSRTTNRKVVLFLGANIGNMEQDECAAFCRQLQTLLSPGDMVLIGFDLKKNPKQVLQAYDDGTGVTAKFNLNLLERINRELFANFALDQFEHYPMYDPISGACRSFLVSIREQKVLIDGYTIHFGKNEVICTEISQKYDLMEIQILANQTGFETVGMIHDSKEWFVDAVWKIKEKV